MVSYAATSAERPYFVVNILTNWAESVLYYVTNTIEFLSIDHIATGEMPLSFPNEESHVNLKQSSRSDHVGFERGNVGQTTLF